MIVIICSLIESIRSRNALFKTFMNLKTRKELTLRSGKKLCEKMLNDVSEFYKHGLRFFKIHPDFGVWTSLQISCSHVV